MASMKVRKSVRSYEARPISAEDLEKLQAYMKALNEETGPFGSRWTFQLIENKKDNVKVGTYGMVKGATFFMTASGHKSARLEDLGYLFEKLILFATSLGLGTVWLGGTFTKGSFAKAIGLKADEVLPIVSAVGYESDKKSLLGQLIKGQMSKRKSWSELFFEGAENDPLAEALEMVRIAPSGVNIQPWRVQKDERGYHFYNGGKSGNVLDVGIGLCHFDLAAKELGFKGKVVDLQLGANYVGSWVEC